MAKQLNLFFGKRPNVAIINKKEQHIVHNILDDILRQVEKISMLTKYLLEKEMQITTLTI